jgi:RND family efflux transporter MFP subunit
VRVAEARLASLAPTIQIPGTVISRNDARISAEVPGRLTWVAEVGTPVDEGEPVARIDDTELALQREEFRGLVAGNESRRGFLEREVERLRQLAAQNVAAKNQLDQVESDLQVSISDFAVARARLGQIEMQLERTRLRAPFDGVVTERLQSPGERSEVGDEIVRLVDPGSLEVVARAPLSSVTYIEQGGKLPVSSQDKNGSGTVRALVPFGDARSHMFELRVEVPADQWRVGENVRLSVPTARPAEVLAVPRDALVLRREGTTVFRVGEGGVVEQLEVQAGVASGELIAVQGSLSPGDRVVIRGAERLRPGQPVRILDEAPPAERDGMQARPASR